MLDLQVFWLVARTCGNNLNGAATAHNRTVEERQLPKPGHDDFRSVTVLSQTVEEANLFFVAQTVDGII